MKLEHKRELFLNKRKSQQCCSGISLFGICVESMCTAAKLSDRLYVSANRRGRCIGESGHQKWADIYSADLA